MMNLFRTVPLKLLRQLELMDLYRILKFFKISRNTGLDCQWQGIETAWRRSTRCCRCS